MQISPSAGGLSTARELESLGSTVMLTAEISARGPLGARDQLGARVSLARASLARAQTARDSATPSPAAQRTLDRMRGFLETLLLGGTSGLTSSSGRAALDEAKEDETEAQTKRDQVRNHFKSMKSENLHQAQMIKKRMDELRQAGFLQKLIRALSYVAAGLSAVAAVASGGALAVAAATLLVASIAVSASSSSEGAQWTSIGLGALGAAAGIANGILRASGEAASTAAREALEKAAREVARQVTTLACQSGQVVCQSSSAIFSGIEGGHRSAALEAEASAHLADAGATTEKREATEKLDALEDLQRQLGKAFDQLIQLFTLDHEAQLATQRPSLGGVR